MREDTEDGAKLAECIGGHLKTLQATSCISYILLYDWSSHLRERINRTFQFRNCHGKFFCSFRCIHGNNSRAVSVWGKRLQTKTSLPLGKRYLPMGKRVGVTTTIIVPLVCGFRRQDLLAWHESFANFYELKSRVCQISPKHSWNNDKRKYVGKL